MYRGHVDVTCHAKRTALSIAAQPNTHVHMNVFSFLTLRTYALCKLFKVFCFRCMFPGDVRESIGIPGTSSYRGFTAVQTTGRSPKLAHERVQVDEP